MIGMCDDVVIWVRYGGVGARVILEKDEKYNVPILGNLATEKQEGYKRFILTQLNSMCTKLYRQVKVEQSTRLISRYDIGI